MQDMHAFWGSLIVCLNVAWAIQEYSCATLRNATFASEVAEATAR